LQYYDLLIYICFFTVQKYFSEFLGTFLLVLVGTGSIIINDLFYPIGNFGIALAFGANVTIVIYVFGKTSGAHINPAVSISFLMIGNLSKVAILPYVLFQTIGAIGASLCLKIIVPHHPTLGTTLPIGHWSKAFLLEFLLTFALLFIILLFSQHDKLKKYTALAVGATVGLEAYFAGPYTGASMNPARSIGPAFVSGNLQYLWVYIISTILGAICATLVFRFVKK